MLRPGNQPGAADLDQVLGGAETGQDSAVDAVAIAGRGLLSGLTTARIEAVETSCTTTLRLALWEHHVVQPAAREILGTDVRALRHVGSYNCRRMRTAQGQDSGWSSHATADARSSIQRPT